LELQVTFASRDKESAVQALEALQKQHDTLASQQMHWDDLRRASEKIDMLTNLIGQADNDELKELRRHRKALEGEHTALQKRFKDLEGKVSNSERAATTARQSLVQAQQRSAEWERRAKEYEGQLEMTQTKLDQAEQTQAQLDADYSLMKLQFEEREADDRLAKVYIYQHFSS
jgi:chromosome segregation ATPase